MQTLDRCPVGVEVVRVPSLRAYRTWALALGLIALAIHLPARAGAEPAFGDSNWVAPPTQLPAGNPAAPGPRVAVRDHEPVGETILRAPFRIAFLPLRLLARGTEKLVGFAEGRVSPNATHKVPARWKLEPVVSAEPGGGFRLTRRIDEPGNAKIFLTGMYGWNDRRRAKLTFRSTDDSAPRGVHVEALYGFRPNATFYGIGNASDRALKSIWLREESRVDANLHFGRAVLHEVRVVTSVSAISARSGFNGSAGVERIEDNFTAAEVPFLERSSRVYSFGLAGDVGALDDLRTPRRGVAARLRAEQFKAADTSDLDYRRFHVEARAYVPVFAERRVLAFRVLHDWVEPKAGSPALPYYRLPETTDELRFNGYNSHRFSDRHLVLAQVEYRWWLTNKIFALANANLGEVASTARRLRYADLHEAYGLGLRYGYGDRVAARVDAAKGSEGLVFNLSLEETF